jgi:antitoxin PrlF
MRKLAKLTSKGQITVPHDIRRALGVGPGDGLEFEKEGSIVRVRPIRKRSVFEKYRGIGNPGIKSGRKAIIRYFRKLRGR